MNIYGKKKKAVVHVGNKIRHLNNGSSVGYNVTVDGQHCGFISRTNEKQCWGYTLLLRNLIRECGGNDTEIYESHYWLYLAELNLKEVVIRSGKYDWDFSASPHKEPSANILNTKEEEV